MSQFGGKLVNYLTFWANYWQNLAELSEREAAPKIATKSRAKNTPSHTSISPKEKYDHLTEYGTQMLALFATDGACTYLSQNFARLTGYDAAHNFESCFFEFVQPDARERLCELIRLQHSSPTPQVFRCKLRHANHQNQWYMFMLHPKKEATQSDVVVVLENIHENILAQNTLQKARQEAELALRSRSEFLANMSHDLRTPLNAVIGFSQMITSEMFGKIDNPHYADYAQHIQASGYDLLSKIEDLLEIASLDAGRVSLDCSNVFFGELMKHVVDAQAHHANSKHVKLVCDATHNGQELHIDRVKVQHMLGHLVSNALKNCKAGDKINIRTSKLKDGSFRIRVIDNGCGIDEIKLRNIQTALQQTNCWTSKDSHSIGLGLALTKEFIELHGGHCVVDSEIGVGTSVDIVLPCECVIHALPQKNNYIRQLVG